MRVFASKAVVEGCFDLSPECCLGLLGVRAEFPVDGRDVTADPVDPPLRVGGEGRPLPEEPVDVNPAEGVIVTEVELAGAVTEDDGALTQSSVVEESAVAGALGGDEAGPFAEDPQLVEVTERRIVVGDEVEHRITAGAGKGRPESVPDGGHRGGASQDQRHRSPHPCLRTGKLADHVVRGLKRRAAANDRSSESEARHILVAVTAADLAEKRKPLQELSVTRRRGTRGRVPTPSGFLIREDRESGHRVVECVWSWTPALRSSGWSRKRRL